MKKAIRKTTFIFLILCLLITFLYTYRYFSKTRLSLTKTRIEFFLNENDIKNILKTGDIICRKGNGIWSDICCDYSHRDKRFSHVGIIINGHNGVKVLHAEANDFTGIGAVIEEDLADFLLCSEGAGIYRLRNRNQSVEDASSFTKVAYKYLNRPFDFKIDLAESDKVYCTELIYCVFAELKPSVTLKVTKNGDKSIVPVDSCNDPELFFEIQVLPDFHKP